MIAPSDMMDGRIAAIRNALDEEGFEHTPIMDQAKRGRLIGGYAYAALPGNLLTVFPMTIEEIEAVRAKSRSWKNLEIAPRWYVIKTCIHRVTKLLPKNPALAKVIALFDREEEADMETTAPTIDGGPPMY